MDREMFSSALGGRYSVDWQENEPTHRYGYVFAGQGGASPGMMAEHFPRPEFRETFAHADALAHKLGLPAVSDHLLREGWTGTAGAQNLSLFALEVALFRAMVARGFAPGWLTAHSFGEYAALVASGMVSFEQMFPLVAHREAICPPPNERGFLIAVGGDGNQTQQWLEGLDYALANFNSATQTVVAVSPEARDAVVERVKSEGGKCKVVPTPQPYHSPLLGDLPEKMGAFLDTHPLDLRPPRIPLYSSVTQTWLKGEKKEFREVVEGQLVRQVHFIHQIAALRSQGCERFCEVGPRVLFRPLIEENCGEKKEVVFAGERLGPKVVEAVRTRPTGKKGKLLGLVNDVIGRITGYELEGIALEDRFQEDLGIDSIRKTEILFTVMDELKVNPEGDLGFNNFEQVGQLVDFLEHSGPAKKQAPKQARFNRYRMEWRPLPLRGGEANAGPTPLIVPLKESDLCREVHPGEMASRLVGELARLGTRSVILLLPQVESSQKIDPLTWMALAREVIRHPEAPQRWTLALVTQGEREPATDAMAAFLKSLNREGAEAWMKRIHFEKAPDDAKLLETVQRELADPTQNEVWYRHRTRLVPHLEPQQESATSLAGTVVAVGGAKGITLELLRTLDTDDTELWVAGRSTQKQVQEALDNLGPRVQYRQVDATNWSEVEGFFREVTQDGKDIELIINGVGVEKSRSLKDKDDEEIALEWNTKVQTCDNLLRAGAEFGAKHQLTFSSVVSWFGNPGQTVYAAANAWIEARTEQAGGTSLVWPPWDNVGMTRNPTVLRGLAAQGFSLLPVKQAAPLFRSDLAAHGEPRVFYWDPSDEWNYGWGGKDGRDFGWLGRSVGRSGGIHLSRELSIQSDPYLGDHRVEGTCYVPAAVGMVQMMATTWLATGKWPRLRDFVVEQPILIQKPQQFSIELETDGSEWVGTVGTSVGGRFRGRLDTKSTRLPSFAFEPPQRFESDQKFYGKDRLFHGPTFHLIHEIFFDGVGSVGSTLVEAFPVPILDGHQFGRLALGVDAAFQTLALGELLGHGVGALPIGVREWIVSPVEEWIGPLQVRVENREGGEENVSADVSLWNGREEVLFLLRGVQLVRVQRLSRPEVA